MSEENERPPIVARGKIESVREEGRLYDIRMANGYLAIAVVPKDGPRQNDIAPGARAEVAFSPYDMSRCKVLAWLDETE